MCQNLFLNKVPTWRIAIIIKTENPGTGVFKNTYFVEHLRTAASEKQLNYGFK